MPKEPIEPITLNGYYLVTVDDFKMVRYFKDGEAYLHDPEDDGENFRGSIAQYDTVELIQEELRPNASQKS